MIKNKIQEIFRDVLNEDNLELSETTKFEELKDWDSALLIDVLVAIENEFSIKLNIEDAQGVRSVSDIFQMIERKFKK